MFLCIPIYSVPCQIPIILPSLPQRWIVPVPELGTSKAGRKHALMVLFLFPDGNYEKAIECAKTYLLFFPNDEVMNQNLAYYTAVLGEDLARPIEPRKVSDHWDKTA